MLSKLKGLEAKLVAYWYSKRSSFHGYVIIAMGMVSGTYAHALVTLGVAESLVHKVAAALLLLGGLLVTPSKGDTAEGP